MRPPGAGSTRNLGPRSVARSALTATFAEDGLLYGAVFGRAGVSVVAEIGQVRQFLSAPGQRPTNLAFDPFGRLGPVVIEDEQGRLHSSQSLFPRFS